MIQTTFLTIKTRQGFEVIPVRYKNKKNSYLMRVIHLILSPFGIDFLNRFWTTIGRTIYYPVDIVEPLGNAYAEVREHELMHVEQFFKYGLFLMILGYLLLPLPFIFSGRWFIERGPYLNDIHKNRIAIPQAVENLHKYYLFPWPRKLMEAWFTKELAECVY